MPWKRKTRKEINAFLFQAMVFTKKQCVGNVVGAINIATHLGKYQNYHFRDEKTEAELGYINCLLFSHLYTI